MQPIIPTPPTTLQSSLTVETESFGGQNNIRRGLGRAAALYLGSSLVDRFIVIQSEATFTIADATAAIKADCSGPLMVTVNGSIALAMKTLLVLDMDTTSLAFLNAGSDPVTLHVSYLMP